MVISQLKISIFRKRSTFEFDSISLKLNGVMENRINGSILVELIVLMFRVICQVIHSEELKGREVF